MNPCKIVYSISWAAGVFSRFTAVHPRGWQIFNVLVNFPPQTMARLIAANDPDWPQIRSMVHTIDKWLEGPSRCYPALPPIDFTTQLYSELVWIYRKKISKELYSLLTTGIERIELKLQGFKGPEELVSEGPV